MSAVRVGWFVIRLVDVDVKPSGLAGVRAFAKEADVSLGLILRPTAIDISGAELTLTGSPDSLRRDWHDWRAAAQPEGTTKGRRLPLTVRGASLHWTGPDGTIAEAHELSATQDENGTHVAAGDAELRVPGATLTFGHVDAVFDRAGVISRARAGALTLGWTPLPRTVAAEQVAPPPDPTPSRPVARAVRGHKPHAVPLEPTMPGPPVVALPNLPSIRAAAAALTRLVAERVHEGADVGADSLVWTIAQDQGRVALTIGPGPLSFAHTPTQLELHYSTNAQGTGTPLRVHVELPTDAHDVVASFEGGPVSLAVLGVREGAMGLVDVDSARVDGRGRVVLAADGSALTFDIDGSAQGLALSHARLATDVVRGIDVSARTRGTLSAEGELRIDDASASLGALHLSASGSLEQKSDHLAAGARFDVAPTACQALLDSMPTGLLPALTGTRIAGTFGAHGRFAFDTRSLDDLRLDYDIQDRCRMVQVPATLDHDRFTRPFKHRIYLPDGSTAERETGPDTPDWTPLEQISPYMQIAVLTTEDGAFPKHHGYNHAAIRASIIANLKAQRFVRGASTITMQLAKNLFLSRDKTLSRKLEEVIFTDYLEQTFSKDEIMELYLNVIEFGPSVYGVTAAADYYFGRMPAELNLAECLFLASLLPAPLRYSAMRDAEQAPDGWMRTIHSLMEVERKRGLITDAELSDGEREDVEFWHGGTRPAPRVAVRARAPTAGSDSDIPDPFETAPVQDAP
ncbi:MAG TPA: biosynthetic peptidoglycan transglycosylase [Polyangiaceae bacterium]